MKGEKEKILLIEDNDDDAVIMSEYLSFSYTLTRAATFKEAVAVLGEQQFDIVLTDLALPDSRGIHTVEKIIEQFPHIPIVVMTGLNDQDTGLEAIHAGAQDYLVKGTVDTWLLKKSITFAIQRKSLEREKQMLEEELKQAQKMEAIGQLVSGIAHDFNNMLTGIMGYVELALLNAEEGELSDFLGQARNACREMAALVKNLLNFSRKNAGEHEVLSIKKLIEEAITILEHSIPKNIAIVYNEFHEDMFIRGNKSAINQIILNLGLNAVDAMGEGGRLAFEFEKIEASADFALKIPNMVAGDYVKITVSDTGIGMDESVRRRIFEPFYTTKTLGTKKGTGLGLAIVWENVKSLHGIIDVHSKIGEGTRFEIYFPVTGPDGKIADPASQKKKRMLKGTEGILVVDDERVVRKIASDLLSSLGYRVYVASNGQNALDVYGVLRERIGCVILDYSMPVMDGLECLKGLRSMSSRLPVLLATGHDIRDKIEIIQRAGADAIIQKPFQLEDLVQKIRAVIDKK